MLLLFLLLSPSTAQVYPSIAAPSSHPRVARPSASSGSFPPSAYSSYSTSTEGRSPFVNRPVMHSYPTASTRSEVSPDKYYSTGFAPATVEGAYSSFASGPSVHVEPPLPTSLTSVSTVSTVPAEASYSTEGVSSLPTSFSSYATGSSEYKGASEEYGRPAIPATEDIEEASTEIRQIEIPTLPPDLTSRLAAVAGAVASKVNVVVNKPDALGDNQPIASLQVEVHGTPSTSSTEEQPEFPPVPTLPQPISSLHLTTEAPENLAYELNYCDKKEFPNEVLATYGLARLDYFIYNTSCSRTFFQCSIGSTFVLKCSSDKEAYDSATHNCNFRHDIRYCPEYDHVTHCTIRETCADSEYACCSLPQSCLPLTKRCDGHADCSDGDDENNCPSCARDEFACVKSGSCIKADKRCDGVADDCGDGSNMDEIGCSKNSTCVGKFNCHNSHEGLSCIDWESHCDGKQDCANGEDETNCKQSESKYLLCENQKQSVTKPQWCDGVAHCADGSDEKYCY